MCATFLYTWNPRKWEWKGLSADVAKLAAGENVSDVWSCGGTKKILRGDRFILIRLGVEPKGIVAVGDITSEPFLSDHWDEKKNSEGKAALRTEVKFLRLRFEPLIALERLQRDFPNVRWTPQIGGLRVPDDVAEQIFSQACGNADGLQALHQSFAEEVWRIRSAGPIERPKGAVVPEKEVVMLQRRRRDVAVASWAQEQANGRCELCQADAPFEDSMGFPFLEVHHIVPLAEGGTDTPANVVALCPNCHRRCHHGRDRDALGAKLAENVRRRGE
jgi:5-methylcytosine-specific restriction protein A